MNITAVAWWNSYVRSSMYANLVAGTETPTISVIQMVVTQQKLLNRVQELCGNLGTV